MEDNTQSQKTAAEKSAAVNATLGGIIRVNNIINQLVMTSLRKDVVGNYNFLIQFQKELYSKMSDKMRHDTDKNLNDIYVKWLQKIELEENQPENKIDEISFIPRILIHELDMMEKYLRCEADRQGILFPDKEKVTEMLGAI